MPLARIDLAEGKTTDYRRTIGEVVYNALVEVLKAPTDDRFQVIAERPVQDFIFLIPARASQPAPGRRQTSLAFDASPSPSFC
jgi:hypothetical protein